MAVESFNALECFIRSAEVGSFAEAARRLSITPAAVGKHVAQLEARLGVRLFQRSTRKLTLTEAGQRFLGEVGDSFRTIQYAVANLASAEGQPAGLLRISMGTVSAVCMCCLCWASSCAATRPSPRIGISTTARST